MKQDDGPGAETYWFQSVSDWHPICLRRQVNLRPLLYLAFVALISPALAWGQRVSFGFIGGTNLTRDFPISRTLYLDDGFPGGLTTFDLYSDTNSFIAGLAFEVAIDRRFALEANALHRNLQLKRRYIFPSGERREDGGNTVGTWEWPILLKYRLPFGPGRLFLEAGPSFRTRHNPAPTEPSQFGATIGAGTEFGFRRLRFSPMIRYTRWKYDGDYPRFATKRDQIEFLTSATFGSSPASWNLRGRKVRVGVIAGFPLTEGLQKYNWPGQHLSEEQGYAAGVAVEVELKHRFSIEVNGLYRPLRAQTVTEFNGATFRDEFTVLTWQFPVLAKYRLPLGSRIQPVIEAGPSFRASGNLNAYNPSKIGFTAGAGGETYVRGMKLGPVLRYTRWARDTDRVFFQQHTRPDQLELLVGLSF